MDELFLGYSFRVYFYEIMQGAIRLKIIILLFILFKINIAFSQGKVFHTINKWGKAPNPSADIRLLHVGFASGDSANHQPGIMEPIRMVENTGNIKKVMFSQKMLFSFPLSTLTITSHFGYRVHPVAGNKKFHNGIDLKASYEPVFAVFSGIIEDAGWGDKEGYYMIVKHSENIQTIYCHLSKIMIQKNKLVSAGQVIAISGNTGQSTGPHLHFAVKFKENYLNPVNMFGIF